MERRRTATHIRNTPAALSNKNRQKKNRKGSVTFTVMGNNNSVVWRFYFYLHGEKSRCTDRNFFKGFSAFPRCAMYE